MTVLLIDNSEIYTLGLQAFLKKINTVKTVHILNPELCAKANITEKVDVVLCDFTAIETPEFNGLFKRLSVINNDIKLVPTVHSVKDLDFSIFNKHNTPGIIYKSISFRNFEFFMLSLSGKGISNNFIDLLEQFALEKRINNRLEKKYRFKNILTDDDIYNFEIKSPVNTNPTEVISNN